MSETQIRYSSGRSGLLVLLGVALLFTGAAVAWRLVRQRNSYKAEQPLTSFVQNGVAVAIAVQRDPSGKMWLAGRFTPQQANFHLYSKDMPKEGIQGLGYPTLLAIATPGNLLSTGALEADEPVTLLHIDILDQSFPIYPNGPVTLRMPIRLASPETTAPTELSVSYMACSQGTCLPPVVDKRFWVQYP